MSREELLSNIVSYFSNELQRDTDFDILKSQVDSIGKYSGSAKERADKIVSAVDLNSNDIEKALFELILLYANVRNQQFK